MKSGFRVAARALRQLGAELITSDEIALNELIKNAFDAHSPRVQLNINAPVDPAALELLAELLESRHVATADALGRISQMISEGLAPAARHQVIKRFHDASKSPETLTESIRAFLGETSWLEITDSGDGMSADDLREAFLVIGTPRKWVAKRSRPASGDPLLGEKGIGRLSMMRLGRYARVQSAQPGDSHWHEIRFDWSLFDDPDVLLEDIPIPVIRAEHEKTLAEQGTKIKISGLYSSWTVGKTKDFIDTYLRRLQDPFARSRRPYPIDVHFNDERLPIPSLFDWFVKSAKFRASFEFRPASPSETDVVLRRRLRWRGASSDDVREWRVGELSSQLDVPRRVLQQLGPFAATCLWYNRQQLVSEDIDRSHKQIQEELNIWCGGFAIYRDGFRVGQTGGMEDDWLEMDKKALRAKGFTLNRYQTVASVGITSIQNPHLVDTSNRESLVSCPEYEALRLILGEIVVDDLRSQINAFREVEVRAAISEETTEESLRRSEQDLRNTVKEVDRLVKELPKEQRVRLSEVRDTLHEHVENVKALRKALEIARETRVEILELAGIGLVVEIVVHELVRITNRTSELLGEIADKSADPSLAKIVDSLRAQVRATNKRIRTVDALSPSGRHRKEDFDVVAFVRAIVSGYEPRFERHHIQCHVLVDGKESQKAVHVHMVRGLVAQVLENLMSNSVYWLQQGLAPGAKTRELNIEIDSKAKTIAVTDNGPGIDPRYRQDIFRPYFTTRRKGKGLGLFIASELAAYHGGSLYLSEAQDKDGRLRTFLLELPRD